MPEKDKPKQENPSKTFVVDGMICELLSGSDNGIFCDLYIGVTPQNRDTMYLLPNADNPDEEKPWPEKYEYTMDDVTTVADALLRRIHFQLYCARYFGVIPLRTNSIYSFHPTDENGEIIDDLEEIDNAPDIMMIVKCIRSKYLVKQLINQYGFFTNEMTMRQCNSRSYSQHFLDWIPTEDTDLELDAPDRTERYAWFNISWEVFEPASKYEHMPCAPLLIHMRLNVNNYDELVKCKKDLNVFHYQGMDETILKFVNDVLSEDVPQYQPMKLGNIANDNVAKHTKCFYFTDPGKNSKPFGSLDVRGIDFYCLVQYNWGGLSCTQCTDEKLSVQFRGNEGLANMLAMSPRHALVASIMEPAMSFMRSTPSFLYVGNMANMACEKLWDNECLTAYMQPAYLDWATGCGYLTPERKGEPDFICALLNTGVTTYALPVFSRRTSFHGIMGFVRTVCLDTDRLPYIVQPLIDDKKYVSFEIINSGPTLNARLVAAPVRYIYPGPSDGVLEEAVKYSCPVATSESCNEALASIDEAPLKYPELDALMFNYFSVLVTPTNDGMLFSRFGLPGETSESFHLRMVEMWHHQVGFDLVDPYIEAYETAYGTLRDAVKYGCRMGKNLRDTMAIIEEKKREIEAKRIAAQTIETVHKTVPIGAPISPNLDVVKATQERIDEIKHSTPTIGTGKESGLMKALKKRLWNE